MTRSCSNPTCRRKAQTNRLICRPCRTIRERESDPIRYSYNNCCKNARRRGIPFNISLDYYRKFVTSTEYMAKKGRFKQSFHVDRIYEWLGYVEGNLQILTNEQNMRKSLEYRYLTDEAKMEFRMKVIGNISNNQADLGTPF